MVAVQDGVAEVDTADDAHSVHLGEPSGQLGA